jgi:RNA polymerase sigma factor (sigma-70 family)
MASTVAKWLVRRDAGWNAAELSDEHLLDQYLSGTESDSQEAFRELVVRHGPMVLGICRHVLGQDQDAEDAFQATFLVLARKGGTIRDRQVLAGWLHEVAYRIAMKLRTSTVRRRALERQGMAMIPPEIEPDIQGERAAWNELRPVLHEEVNRLPDKYRIPVILSYLEGKTNEEVAELLQWPVGTVKGRLSRARELLRSRLTRRGLALSAAFLMTSLSRGRVFAESVPTELIQRTVRLALVGHSLSISAATESSPSAAELDDADIPPADSQLNALVHGSTRTYRILLIVALFLAFLLAVAIGTSVAVVATGGGLSDIRSIGRLFDLRSLLPMGSPLGRGAEHCGSGQ